MSTAGVAILEREVRELIRRRGVDPLRDKPGIDQLVADALADYDTRTALGVVPPLADVPGAVKAVLDAVAGLGPLQKYLDDPEVEEVWINSPGTGVAPGRRGLVAAESAWSPQARQVAPRSTQDGARSRPPPSPPARHHPPSPRP